MNSYILLRNNKESGPFDLAGLQQQALLPTDLIWVECQSVCWLHPYEIKELKSPDPLSSPVTSMIPPKKTPVSFEETILPVKTVLPQIILEQQDDSEGNKEVTDIELAFFDSVFHDSRQVWFWCIVDDILSRLQLP